MTPATLIGWCFAVLVALVTLATLAFVAWLVWFAWAVNRSHKPRKSGQAPSKEPGGSQ